MEKKTYYKVLEYHPNHTNKVLGRSSWAVNGFKIKDYVEGVWTYAPAHNGSPTKLFVFDDLDKALRYARARNRQCSYSYGRYKADGTYYGVWECDVLHPTKNNVKGCINPLDISKFWKHINTYRTRHKCSWAKAIEYVSKNYNISLTNTSAVWVSAVRITKQLSKHWVEYPQRNTPWHSEYREEIL